MKKSSFNQVIDRINSSKNICIISHVNPDGDSIGSLLGLGLALKKYKDKRIKLAINDEIPKIYTFLPGIEYLEKTQKDEAFDLLIALDCSDLKRLGLGKYVTDNADFIINIDHHKSNDFFGDENIVFPGYSSTGEILFNLLKAMNIEIDTEIATCLYVSISTDTGSFKYDSTSPNTLEVAANLMRKNIDLNKITTSVYQSRSLEKTCLLIKSLNSMELYMDNRIGIISVTEEMIESCNAALQDIDGIIEFVRDIDTVEVACMLKELDQEVIKVGFRSKKDIDVAEIAMSFEGGGHSRASGCTIYDTIDNSKDKVLDEIKKAFR